jgi:sigma-B regulation protein RsbU (phosphoserine phosphatase)
MPDTPRAARTERFDMGALRETSLLLSSSLDRDFIFGRLLLTAMSKTLATRGAVLVPDADGWHVATQRGMNGVALGDCLIPHDRPGPGAWNDAAVASALAPHRLAHALPVRFGDDTLAILALGRPLTGELGEEARAFVDLLLGVAAPAIQNAQTVEALRASNRTLDGNVHRLTTLFALAQQFSATPDRTQHARTLGLTLMGQMTVSRYLFVVERTDRSGGYELVAARGLPPDAGRFTADEVCGLDRTLGPDDVWPEAYRGVRERGIVVLVPLKQQGRTCGLLGLGARMNRQPFSPADLGLVEAIGQLALTAVRNSFLLDEQVQKQRMEQEMKLARSIQERLLPQRLPTVPGATIVAAATPAREVGGDYYDAFELDGGRTLLAIADVTGKGMAAALLMANIQACLHTLRPMDMSLAEAVGHINRVICANTTSDRFITFFVAIYHPDTRALVYVNGGHDPPFVVRAGGALEPLEVGGLLLGVMDGMPYQTGRATLEPGDALVAFTDGVTEVHSPDGEEWGTKRLETLLAAHAGAPAEQVRDAILSAVDAFQGPDAEPFDDLTLIVLRADD